MRIPLPFPVNTINKYQFCNDLISNKVISNKISTFIDSSNIISKDDISSNNINSYNLITKLFEINSSSYIDSLIEIICPKENPFKQINKNECVKNCEINDIIETNKDQQRQLDEQYAIVFVDATYFSVKENGIVVKAV